MSLLCVASLLLRPTTLLTEATAASIPQEAEQCQSCAGVDSQASADDAPSLLQSTRSHLSTAGQMVHGVYAGRPCLIQERSGTHDVQLVPPGSGEYALLSPGKTYFGQWQQEQKLWNPVLSHIDTLKGKGYTPFFVESGARDGEKHSNTLYLERSRGWQGLLVEPSNKEFPALTKKNRKAWAFHGALSPTNGSMQLKFFDDGIGLSHAIGAVGTDEHLARGSTMVTPAEPLITLLQRINPPVSAVDFWSLDIEGSEVPVLEATDFSQVEVGVLLIEIRKADDKIREVMKAKGFREVATTIGGGHRPLDRAFVNPKYFEKRGLDVPKPFGNV